MSLLCRAGAAPWGAQPCLAAGGPRWEIPGWEGDVQDALCTDTPVPGFSPQNAAMQGNPGAGEAPAWGDAPTLGRHTTAFAPPDF